MKRFFCSTCKKVRRVRRLPVILTDTHSSNVVDRVGVCDWHSTGRIRPVTLKPVYKSVEPVAVRKRK